MVVPPKPNVYWSDTHLGHHAIIEHCRRPFPDATEMNWRLVSAMQLADAQGHRICHLGDVALRFDDVVAQWGPLQSPKSHLLVSGNHDRTGDHRLRRLYYRWFGRLVGTEATWTTNRVIVDDVLDGRPVKVLLSHLPQRDLGGCDVALYGHFHDHWGRRPERFAEEWAWLADSPVHFNVSVEWLDYRPQTLADLIALRAAGRLLR